MSVNTGGNAAAPAAQATTGQLFSFIEHSCFDNDDNLRQQRAPVVFRLFSVGRALGAKIDITFNSDYGLYYGGDDEYLAETLNIVHPTVDWTNNLVYHRWLDQSRIQIMSQTTGKIVAQLETRKYEGRRVSLKAVASGEYGENVVTLDMLRLARIQRVVDQLTADREGSE